MKAHWYPENRRRYHDEKVEEKERSTVAANDRIGRMTFFDLEQLCERRTFAVRRHSGENESKKQAFYL